MSSDLFQQIAGNDIAINCSALATTDIADPNKEPVSFTLPTKVFRSELIDMSEAGMGTQTVLFKNPGLNVVTFETPSIIMILRKQDSAIQYQTNKFLLQSITKPQQEKFQVIETFGKSHLYFYGERTRVYNIQGVLLDAFYDHTPTSNVGAVSTSSTYVDQSYKNQWATGFQNFYDTKLRGTILKDTGNIAALYVNGWLIKGYPINLTIMKESNALPDGVTFQMSWVIEKEILLDAKQTDPYYKLLKDSDALVRVMNEKSALLTKYNNAIAIVQEFNTNGILNSPERTNAETDVRTYEKLLTEKEKEMNGILAKYGPRTRKTLNID